MREATIGGLSALDEVRPRKPGASKAAPRGTAGTRVPGQGGWARFRRFRTKATLVFGSLGFTAIMVGIVFNATVMQKGHHPAPLFASAAPPPVATRSEVPAAAVAPQPLPVVPAAPAPDATAAIPPSTPPAAAPAAAVHRAPHAAAPSHPAKAEDGIARLLDAAGPGPRPAHPASVHARTKATATAPHARAPVAKARPAQPVANVKPSAATGIN